MSDIFDISDLGDVPSIIKNGLKRDPFGEEILQLFKLAQRPLSIDEVYIAHYRMFSAEQTQDGGYKTKQGIEPKTKRQIMLKLYNMSKDENAQIEQFSRGVYQLKYIVPNLFNV